MSMQPTLTANQTTKENQHASMPNNPQKNIFSNFEMQEEHNTT